jgi:hypothetical protein
MGHTKPPPSRSASSVGAHQVRVRRVTVASTRRSEMSDRRVDDQEVTSPQLTYAPPSFVLTSARADGAGPELCADSRTRHILGRHVSSCSQSLLETLQACVETRTTEPRGVETRARACATCESGDEQEHAWSRCLLRFAGHASGSDAHGLREFRTHGSAWVVPEVVRGSDRLREARVGALSSDDQRAF